MCTALGIGERDDLALTRHNLLHVGDGLLEHSVMGRDDDHRIRAALRAALLA